MQASIKKKGGRRRRRTLLLSSRRLLLGWVLAAAIMVSVAILLLLCRDRPSLMMKDKTVAEKHRHVDKHRQHQDEESVATDSSSPTPNMQFSNQQQQQQQFAESTTADTPATNSYYYTTANIINTARTLFYHAPRVLIFTGRDADDARDDFRAYTLTPQRQRQQQPDPSSSSSARKHHPLSGKRSELLIPLLVDALVSHFPDRFSSKNSSRPFQLVFTTADVSYSTCTFGNCTDTATTITMAPWINAGSIFRNNQVPGLEMFPNDARMECLWHWRRTGNNCTSHLFTANTNMNWTDLYPTIIWRGSAYPFLHFWNWQQQGETNEWNLTEASFSNRPSSATPRQRCVDLARQAERTKRTASDPSRLWIDCRYASTTQLSRMSPQRMLRYRYQIDLGGLGGTTWAGTLDKLSFPGLLLHHETPAQDWFYPQMKPWVHYVPIRTDLSDLRDKYEWAEAHPKEAEEIARAGTAFVKDLMSSETVREEYERYFVRSLGRYVQAYQPAMDETLDGILGQYEEEGFVVEQFSECNRTHCATNLGGQHGGVHVESLVF
jgi:hypothetical protein